MVKEKPESESTPETYSPAFQWYPKDWLSSLAVRNFDAEQRGWYIQLLNEAWENTPQGTLPDDPDVQAAIGEYLAYINKYFYTCEISALRGLADMWEEDPRFAANYERVREGGAAFVREAAHLYCDRNE